MKSSTLTPMLKALQGLMHVSFLILLGFATFYLTPQNRSSANATRIIGALVFVIYLVGAYLEFRESGKTKATIWIITLTLGWAALAYVNPMATYMVIPLIMLQLHALSLKPGVTLAIGSSLYVALVLLVFSNYEAVEVIGPISVAIVGVIVGLLAKAMQDEVKNRQRLIDQLIATRNEVMAQERALATETERTRLAREIHDTVAQGLSSVVMLTNSMKNDDLSQKNKDKVELINSTAKENLTEARNIIKELKPAPLKEQTLVAALERICADSIIDTSCEINQTAKLPRSMETAILRIAQSLIANVNQHSQASKAKLTLKGSAKEAKLVVQDNGIGIKEAKGFGLTTIEQRVSEFDGKTVIEVNEGTKVSVTIPLKE
ncbi:MAG: sensor histidine kinase [Micrococcaceae bacterium]